MGIQALIWFGVAGGAGVYAVSLLYTRFVKRDPMAVRSRGGFTLFAVCMLLFAFGALAAGIVAVRNGGS
ncbi:MAG: hypothetical protein IT337_08665 [Thermomicrobiales bacterium]|nr:hypothetical protein [Thermomicrobiales bacterium]